MTDGRSPRGPTRPGQPPGTRRHVGRRTSAGIGEDVDRGVDRGFDEGGDATVDDGVDPTVDEGLDEAREHADALRRIVLRKSIQRERARRTGSATIWSWMGTFGLVGWTVAVPTLLGVALGVFLDGRTGGSISFTITFLVVGAAVGVTMAWYWIRRESEGER